MTTPVPADSYYDAPSLIGTGVSEMVQTAGRLGVTWGVKLATVLESTTETSNTVTVVTDGDLVQILTIPLVNRHPVYTGDEEPETFEPGDRVYVLDAPTGPFAISETPTQEFTTTSALFLYDKFDRNSSGGWGYPTYGPQWSPSSGMGVVVGRGEFGNGGEFTTSVNFDPQLDNLSVYLVNVRPSAPVPLTALPSNFFTINARGVPNFASTIPSTISTAYVTYGYDFYSDSGVPYLNNLGSNIDFNDNTSMPILGITDTNTPIDIYMTIISNVINIWAAPTSVGINTTAPQNIQWRSRTDVSGPVSLTWSGSVPLQIGTVVIRGVLA